MKLKKHAVMIAAGILCIICAVIWMVAVKASVTWYMIPAFIGGWLIVEGIMLRKQNK